MAIKYIQLAEDLRKNLPEYRKKGRTKLPTEMELMAQYQVSRQTVRQSLSLLLEEGLIEKRQGSGTYLVPQTQNTAAASHTIAILTPYANDYTFQTSLWEIQSLFSLSGYESQVCSTEYSFRQERAILQNLLDHPVRAVLAEGLRTAFPSPNRELYQKLSACGTAVLFYESSPFDAEESSIPCVQADDFSGGYLLTRRLIDLGHHTIGGIFQSDSLTGHRRFEGCIRALCDCGCAFDDRHFYWYDAQQRSSLSEPLDFSRLLGHLQTQMADCSAIVCQSDELACFLIRELNRPGRFPLRQPAMAAFGTSYLRELGPVPILTASHGTLSLWKESAKKLLQMLSGQTVSSDPYPWIEIS